MYYYYFLFENLKQLLTLSWFWSRLRSYASVDTVYVPAPFLSCRKHAIQRMPRIWHLPSRVGKTYECCTAWNMMDAKEQHQYSLFQCYCCDTKSGVRDLTSLIFSRLLLLLFCTAVTLPSYFEWGVHTIEKGTWQFRVRQFGNYLTLCNFCDFTSRFIYIWHSKVFKPINSFKCDVWFFFVEIFLSQELLSSK
jgi:hypothetical protein